MRKIPRWGQVTAVAGLVLVVLIGIGVSKLFGGGDPPAKIGTQPKSSPSPSGPLIPVQEYRDDRAFVVNVPSAWTKKATNSYIDFVDPSDEGRRLRVNVEKANSTAEQYLEVAERGLKKTTSNCPAPYTRVGLISVELDHHPAAELEYTCGSGEQMRHGVWRAVIQGGKAYWFFVSVPDLRFTESKVVYEEMVRSYHLTVQETESPSGG